MVCVFVCVCNIFVCLSNAENAERKSTGVYLVPFHSVWFELSGSSRSNKQK